MLWGGSSIHLHMNSWDITRPRLLKMKKDDHFSIEWGYFTNNVILFGLKNVPIV